MKELARFFLVSAAGVVIDISIAYAIVIMLDTQLWVAAAVGFVIAAGGNYVLHEVWTFRGREQRLSRARALQYLGISLFTLLSRLSVVAWLSSRNDESNVLMILITGAAVSFFVNYAISKLFLFSKSTKEKGLSR